MVVVVRIQARGPKRPPAGAPIRVEVRDTTFEDARAETIASAEGRVRDAGAEWLDEVELSVTERPDSAVVWVHVDVDEDGRVSEGDFITMESYPLPPGETAELEVSVRLV